MRIINKTRGTVLSEHARVYDRFLGRLRGLMLSGKRDAVLVSPKQDVASSTIHMWFMLHAIDVVWVDGGMRVVDVKKQVPPAKPWNPKTLRTHTPRKPAKYVIELSGENGAGETVEGDVIAFQ